MSLVTQDLLDGRDDAQHRGRTSRQRPESVISEGHLLTTGALGSVAVRAFLVSGEDGERHVVTMVYGDIDEHPPLVRVHSRCLYGEVLGSLDCDCLAQLNLAIERFQEEGHGILVYLEQEGRGCGLISKARAYSLREHAGLDTVDAYVELGLPLDARQYSDAALAIKSLGVDSIRLLTNNSRKVEGLANAGVRVERIPHRTVPTVWDRDYLMVKQQKLGHDLALG
jgi:3,4-dihydroxy 2-butanone 4-phosphate synthase/GTP cyclohydrolase II